jgi:hypothetical protein
MVSFALSKSARLRSVVQYTQTPLFSVKFADCLLSVYRLAKMTVCIELKIERATTARQNLLAAQVASEIFVARTE